MSSWSDHGVGGPAVRRMEKRYNAASQVAVAGLLAALTFWVLIGRLDAGGDRAVHVEGPWYAAVCAVPLVATLGAAALVARGRLRAVWIPATLVAAAPLLVAGGARLFDGPTAGHVEVVRVASCYLLALPFLVGAAVTGRDARAGATASAWAVVAFLVVSSGDDLVWGTLVWVPLVVVVVAAAAALSERRVALGWAVGCGLALAPLGVGVVAVVVHGVGTAANSLLWQSLLFVPAAVAVLVGVWRESTDPLAGLHAIEPADLRVEPRRRRSRPALVPETAAPASVVPADLRR